MGFETFANEHFLEDYQGRRGVRSSYYKQQVRQLIAYWKDTPLVEIDRLALDRYRRFLSKQEWHGRPLKPETIRKRLVCLTTMLGTAYDWGMLDTNPAWRLSKPSGDTTPYREFSGDEWRKFIRTTAASWLAAERFSEFQIGTLLGHKMSGTVTQRYVRFPEVPGKVVEAQDRIIGGWEADMDRNEARDGSA